MKPKAKIINNQKQCRGCLTWIDIDKYGTFLDKKDREKPFRYINSRCKSCSSKSASLWRKNNRDKAYDTYLKTKQRLLDEIYKQYGKECVCCGESNEIFLTIDHKNNDGFEDRQTSIKWYKWIIDNNFPDSLQIMCWNCNCGRQRNNYVCPHQETR